MSGRRRGMLIGLGLAGLLVATEVGLNWWRGTQACVEVGNEGAEPIEDLTLTLGLNRVYGGRVEPGSKVALYLSGRESGTLLMTFRQQGNALGSYQVQGFDPAMLKAEDFKLVLNVRPNEIERQQDDADPATPLGRAWKAVWMRVNKALEIPD